MKILGIVTAFFIATSCGYAYGYESDPIFLFDSDGGNCDYTQGGIYAEFGIEGMAYIEGGNKYTGTGGFILDYKILKNGLIQYHIGPVEDSLPDYYITLDPKGGMIAGKVNEQYLIYEEGMLNTLKFKPCK